MCGIAGFIGKPLEPGAARQALERLEHRGPDQGGEWRSARGHLWLGHRRLSILDLSEHGRQPMASRSGRWVIAYNGEVFNHLELRRELEPLGYRFAGGSDTEVILAAIEQWGVEAAVGRFVGMFAFACYSQERDELWLVRDRMGIKPLLFAEAGGCLAFASELRALRPMPGIDWSHDPRALADYFRFLCVPAPATAFVGVRKLEPGTMLVWKGGHSRKIRYWNLDEVAERARRRPFRRSMAEAADELHGLLREAVRLRLMADVPVGAFLSGGLDSSLVSAIAQEQSGGSLQTFTISFAEGSHNEAPYAAAIARHLGTRHSEFPVSEGDLLRLAPEVTTSYGEPFADISAIPTLVLCRHTRKAVTVALSGDGGDELFGGYPRYFWARRMGFLQRALTSPGAALAGAGLEALPEGLLNAVAPASLQGSEGLHRRVQRFAGYLRSRPDSVYQTMVSTWPEGGPFRNDPGFAGPVLRGRAGLHWSEEMMLVDQGRYLPDDILTKVDIASMASSLEARVPLLDHRVVEWSWRLPAERKLSRFSDKGKLVLREVLKRYVPQGLFERPKQGFGLPMEKWLRAGLRPWAADMLSPANLAGHPELDAGLVSRTWAEHLGGRNRQAQLWTVLAYLSWKEAR